MPRFLIMFMSPFVIIMAALENTFIISVLRFHTRFFGFMLLRFSYLFKIDL